MVYGIVTLIEGEAGAQVHALWAELRERLGPAATAEMTHPHTTYYCADGYEPAALEELLSRAAARMAPFTIRAPGVGFVGTPEGGVAWVNLSRTPRLDELHRSLWSGACEASQGTIYDRYDAESWVPHVTLSYAPEVLSAPALVVEAMRAGRLPRELRIDNLALIRDTGQGHELEQRFALGGGR